MHDLTPQELLVAIVSSALIGLGCGSIALRGPEGTTPAEILFFVSLSGLCLAVLMGVVGLATVRRPILLGDRDGRLLGVRSLG